MASMLGVCTHLLPLMEGTWLPKSSANNSTMFGLRGGGGVSFLGVQAGMAHKNIAAHTQPRAVATRFAWMFMRMNLLFVLFRVAGPELHAPAAVFPGKYIERL